MSNLPTVSGDRSGSRLQNEVLDNGFWLHKIMVHSSSDEEAKLLSNNLDESLTGFSYHTTSDDMVITEVEAPPPPLPVLPVVQQRKRSFLRPCGTTTTASRSIKKSLHDYRRVTEYEDRSSHFQFLFQVYGSVWPGVFPWCVATCAYTFLIFTLKQQQIVDLTIHNSTGYTFLNMLVSFLLVTKTTITYNKFVEHLKGLQSLFGAAREIVQHTCLLTLTNRNIEAVTWRRNVAYHTITALRAAIAALEYRSSGIPSWEVLPSFEDEETALMVACSDNDHDTELHGASLLKDLAHDHRSPYTENYRTPRVWSFNLRKTILLPRGNSSILSTHPLVVTEELRILDIVSKFVTASEDMQRLATTSFAFPLAQMSRTFLLFWVFSLPLVLVKDDNSLWATMLVVFGVTYGFFGLEYASLELSDPYGDDPNDFPGQSWTEVVAEDIYITIYKTDGYPSAMALRNLVAEGATGKKASSTQSPSSSSSTTENRKV